MAKATANDVTNDVFGTLTDEQQTIVDALTDEQRTKLAELIAMPANAPMSRLAESLTAQPKVFRGWARQTLKLGVSGHAAGCTHQVPTFDDHVAMVKKYVKDAS